MERVEPSSAGAWRHRSRLRNHCQGLTFNNIITRFIHHWNLQTVYGKWRMMKIRTIGTYKIIQLYESERLDDSTPNINLIGLHLFFKLYLLFVSNKMWSYPFNIAQSLTYKPATSAWGCNTVSSNTDSTPTMKRGQKWAYCGLPYPIGLGDIFLLA